MEWAASHGLIELIRVFYVSLNFLFIQTPLTFPTSFIRPSCTSQKIEDNSTTGASVLCKFVELMNSSTVQLKAANLGEGLHVMLEKMLSTGL